MNSHPYQVSLGPYSIFDHKAYSIVDDWLKENVTLGGWGWNIIGIESVFSFRDADDAIMFKLRFEGT